MHCAIASASRTSSIPSTLLVTGAATPQPKAARQAFQFQQTEALLPRYAPPQVMAMGGTESLPSDAAGKVRMSFVMPS